MLKRALLAGLFVVLSGASSAMAEGLPASKDLAKTSSGIYTLDKGHASLLFKINHLGFSNYHGRFNAYDAKINFDAKAPEKSLIEVTIDTTSIDTNNPSFATELKGEKFFNTAKFPTATFKSLHTTRSGDSGTMIGELTMLGVTKPVTLNVVFHGAGVGPFSKKETLGFSAAGVINRSQWGLNALVPMVGDEVQIEIEAEFHHAAAAATTAPAAAAPSSDKDDVKKK